jgi:hypothetical protein
LFAKVKDDAEKKESIVFLEANVQKKEGREGSRPCAEPGDGYFAFLGAFLSSFLAFFFMDGSFFRS